MIQEYRIDSCCPTTGGRWGSSGLSIQKLRLGHKLKVEVGSLSHYLQSFCTSQVVVWDFFQQQYLRLFQHTELEHTPSNLYQQPVSRDSFHSGRFGGLPIGCAISGSVVILLEDLTNGPRSVSCDRAIRYSCLGVRSVGPVEDFLKLRYA